MAGAPGWAALVRNSQEAWPGYKSVTVLGEILLQSPGNPKGRGPVTSEGATPRTAQLPAITANANRTVTRPINPRLLFIIFAPPSLYNVFSYRKPIYQNAGRSANVKHLLRARETK